MKKSGNIWVKQGRCYFDEFGDGDKSGSPSHTCSLRNVGSNTYQMGIQHSTTAPAYLFGSDDVLDYYSGSNHASTERLEICTGC